MLKKQNKQHDSITKVNPKQTHGLGLWGNPRVVMGVRVDSELKKRFKLVSKRVFGSTCNPIESFMATVVSCAESGVNFGNTIEVGKIVIERNLRERRKLVVETVEGSKEFCFYCLKSRVRRAAVGLFKYVKTGEATGEVYALCSHHANELLESGNWGVVE